MSIRIHSEAIRAGGDRCLALLFLLALLLATPPAFAQDDAMAPYRERFKSGMDRYKAGDLAGALAWWEPIYREVGPDKGYRVAFDLARAYDKLSDATRAAERYEAFLASLDARRARGEALEPIVRSEETDARKRLAQIIAEKGRVSVEAGAAPVSAQIDALEPRLPPFVTYVAPGAHTVTFSPGTKDATKRDVDVSAGALVTVAPPPPPAAVVAPSPPIAPPAPPQAEPARAEPSPAPPVRREVDHPFSPAVLYLSSAATVGAIVFTSIEYARALSAKRDFTNASAAPLGDQLTLRDSYDGIRPLAYAGLGASIGLALVTAGLTTWYALGAKEHDVVVAPLLEPARGGATAGFVVRY